jgi:hypothetical protein
MGAWPANPWVRWFRLVVWLGILGNLVFAVPAVFAPEWLMGLLHMDAPRPWIWLQDAGGLLFLLTLTFIPAASDPFRYKFNAAVAVAGRLAFGVFWFWQVLFNGYPSAFLTLAYGDSLLGVVLLLLYLPVLRYEYLRPERPE